MRDVLFGIHLPLVFSRVYPDLSDRPGPMVLLGLEALGAKDERSSTTKTGSS